MGSSDWASVMVHHCTGLIRVRVVTVHPVYTDRVTDRKRNYGDWTSNRNILKCVNLLYVSPAPH